MRLYRRSWFGRLAEFHVLDTRQYRTDQPYGDALPRRLPGALRRRQRRLLGPEQQRWLRTRLVRSTRRWNVLAPAGVPLPDRPVDFVPGEGTGQGYYVDGWDGYVAERRRLLRLLEQRQVQQPGGPDRRLARQLGGRAEGRLRRPVLGTVGDRVRLHLDHVRRRRVPERRLRRGGAAGQRAHPATSTTSAATSAARSRRSSGAPTTGSCRTCSAAVRPCRTAASFVVEDGRPGVARA